MSYRVKTRARGQHIARLSLGAQASGPSSRADGELEVYCPVLPPHVEGQTHLGQDTSFSGDVHGDSEHTPPEPGTSTPLTLSSFVPLSDIGIVSHGHFDRPPYTTIPPNVDLNAEIETLDGYVGDEADVAQDMHPNDAGAAQDTRLDDDGRRPLEEHEIRTISKYMCTKL
jgi:hypothetical protein